MSSDGKVVIEVTADPSDYDKAISGLGDSTRKSLSTAIKGSFVGNLFAQAFSKAAGVIANSMDSAISRVDTMKNFPRVMESLGYSADDAASSIQKMSDHLTGLPTRLDSMTSSVQKIVPTVKDVGKATDIMLAFNDALLAGGSSTQVQEAALEQFSQALAKGKPELEDWRSIQTAMPGQLDQVAQSMLGQGKSATDLYNALKTGKVSMNDFCDALVRLDKEGGNGFASFSEQAKLGTQGIATSFSNMENAVVKGLASVLDAVGSDNIVGVMEGANKVITQFFKSVSSGVSAAMPSVKQFGSLLVKMGPQVAVAVAGFAGFKSVGGFIADAATKLGQLEKGASLATKATTLLGGSFSPVGIALTVAAAGAGVLAAQFADYAINVQNAEKASTGLNQAVSDTTGLSNYHGQLESVGEQAETAATSLSDLNASFASHVDAMNKNTQAAQEQLGTLNTAQAIIQQYAGQTDLSAEAQGRLQWALQEVNDQFGLSLTAADAASNSYKDQSGNVVNLKESINDLVNAKKREVEMDALSANYKETMAAKTEAAKAYADAVKNANERKQELVSTYMTAGVPADQAETTAQAELNRELEEYKQKSDDAAQACKDIEKEMADTSKSTSDAADAFDEWGNKVDDLTNGRFKALLDGKGGIAGLKDALRELGADTSRLSALTEPELEKLAAAYDGSTESIKGALEELKVGTNDASQATQEMASSITESFNSIDGVSEAMSNAGINMDEFAQKCADAGLSTQDFAGMGADSFAQLAEACGGNIDLMVGQIAMYNSVPLVDKDGNVNINDAKLIDSQGKVYTWNGTALVDKNGNAAVNDTSVVDATGHVWTWDGAALQNKDAQAQVKGNVVDGTAKNGANDTNSAVQRLNGKSINVDVNGNYDSAAGKIWDLGRSIGGLFSKTVDVVTNFITNGSRPNAKGGFRPHASGGFVPRYHASGGIATKAVPLDIVGEDGAEAIVPLTNERYAKPFAQIIAREVNALSDMDAQFDRARAQQSMESATQYALLGEAFMRGIAEVTTRLDGVNQRLDRIERKMDRELTVRIDNREFGRLVRSVQ